jgi:hypothetical protein
MASGNIRYYNRQGQASLYRQGLGRGKAVTFIEHHGYRVAEEHAQYYVK